MSWLHSHLSPGAVASRRGTAVCACSLTAEGPDGPAPVSAPVLLQARGSCRASAQDLGLARPSPLGWASRLPASPNPSTHAVRQHSPGGAACAPSLPGATPLPCYPGLLPPLIPDAPLGLTPCGGKVRPQLPPGLAPLGMELEDFGLTLASPVTLIQAPAVGLGASCLDDPALHAWPGVPSPLSLVLPGSPGPAPQPAQATPRFHSQAGAPRDAGDDQPLTPHQLSHWAHVLRTPDPGECVGVEGLGRWACDARPEGGGGGERGGPASWHGGRESASVPVWCSCTPRSPPL